MSTSIRWGMRLAGGTLDAAWAALDRVRPEAEALVTSEKAAALARLAVERLDEALMRGEDPGDPLGEAWRAYGASRRPGADPDPRFDFGFRIVLCPHGSEVYAAAFLGRRAYGDWLLGRPFATDFSWDDGERPDGVPAAEWRARGRVWRGILAGAPCGRLSRRGLAVEYHDVHAEIGADRVVAAAPDRERRIVVAARAHAVDARVRETGGDVHAAVLAIDWLGTPAGASALAAGRDRAEAALPPLTEAILRGRR